MINQEAILTISPSSPTMSYKWSKVKNDSERLLASRDTVANWAEIQCKNKNSKPKIRGDQGDYDPLRALAVQHSKSSEFASSIT